MNMQKLGIALLVALLGLGAGAPARAADINIAQDPLFLLAPIQPAMVMGVDDSGSMDSEVMLPTNDGALWWEDNEATFTGWETDSSAKNDVWTGSDELNFNAGGGNSNRWHKYTYLFPNGGLRRLGDDHHAIPPLPQFAYARSHVFNPIYFDPAQTYEPYPSEGSTTFTDANPSATYWDIVHSNEKVDLTQSIRRDENDWVFRMQEGMVVPADTIVDDPDQGDFCIADDLDWEAVPSDTTLGSDRMFGGPGGDNDSCRIAIEYYPATFWLPASDPAPAGFIGTAITGGEAPDGSPMLGYEIKPNNFSNYGKMIQNFANWFQYYRKRVHLTRSAIGQAFQESNFLRIGAFRINSLNDVTMLDMASSADRKSFFDDQYQLRANGGTPNKPAVYHMGEQFERTGSGAPIVEACQKNFGVLFTDGFSNSDGPPSPVGNADGGSGSELQGTFLADNQSNTMADIAYHFYSRNLRTDLLPGGQVPVPTACSAPNPPLELDCNDDPHMNFFAVMLGGVGLEFRVNQAATADPYEYVANGGTIDWPTEFPNRNPTAIDDIWHAALNARGNAFSADRPQELIEAFASLLREVASRIQPVGVSATSTRLDQDSLFFESELDSTRWSGDLRARNADDQSLEWEASNKLPDWFNRKIITGNGSGGAVAFNSSMGPAVKDRIFGTAITDPVERTEIIEYLQGQRTNEEQNGGTLRDRDGLIGDIANSRPKFAGPGNEGWGRLDATYLDYIADSGPKNTRTPLVLVGANDGMLHAFDADTGVEKFAYIPAAVHSKLPALADPGYGHQFYVDGQVRVADAKIGGSWTTVAVGGLGGGGKGVYALDISSPSSPSLLWELSADDHAELGHVYGAPVVTRLGNGRWVAIFGNGYNSDAGGPDQPQPYLFVVDLASGTPTKIAVPDTSGNGLSGVAAFLDPVSRLFTSRIYAGDLAGNMWRFDFDSGGSGSVGLGGSPLITDPDGRPIASAPSVAENPGGGLMVYFGTGKLIEAGDRVGGATDIERFYAVRDRNNSIGNNPLNALEEAVVGTSGGERTLVGADVTGDSDGWYADLTGSGSPTGERVLSRPEVVFGTLVFTTFQPDDDPCAPGGQRRIYVVDALTGTGLLDDVCVNCAVIDVGLGAPVDPAIVIRPPAERDPPDDSNTPGNPFNPGGSGPTSGNVGSRTGWCSELVILVPGQGFVTAGRVCDGRQAWRQAR